MKDAVLVTGGAGYIGSNIVRHKSAALHLRICASALAGESRQRKAAPDLRHHASG